MPSVEREAVALVLSAVIACLEHQERHGRIRHVVNTASLAQLLPDLRTMHGTPDGDAKELHDAIALLQEFLAFQSDQDDMDDVLDSLYPPSS